MAINQIIMDNSFFNYLQLLELLAFFSGYPMIYAIVFFFTGNQLSKTGLKNRLVLFLPIAYALVGTLYIGLQLKNIYPDYSLENLKQIFLVSFLKIWGILSILFWIPVFRKKPVFSLLHSLVYFFLLAKNLFRFLAESDYPLSISNEMKIYTDSLLLNVGCLLIIVFVYVVFNKLNKRTSNS